MKVLAVAAAVALFTTSGSTQPASRPPFDETAKALPRHYAGDNFEAVLKSLKLAPKSEYETSAEYHRRLNIGPHALRAFLVELMDVIYDADTEELRLSVFTPLTYIGYEQANNASFVTRSHVVSERKHVAQNAFGARVEETVVDEVRYSVINVDDDIAGRDITFAIKVPRAAAKKLRELVHVVAICAIGPESRVESLDDSRYAGATGRKTDHVATFEHPRTHTTYEYSIRAHVHGFWAFRSDTGEILKKLGPSGEELNIRPPISMEEALQRLQPGMSAEAVRRFLGEPDRVVGHTSSEFEDWIYSTVGITVQVKSSTHDVFAAFATPRR